MLTAITRGVSASLAACELTWLEREPINIEEAIAEHNAYERCLADLGVRVISLPALDSHPDAVFVEDPAIVLDEVAVITTMGCESRRGERASLAAALEPFRPLIHMRDPAKLEGGDVMRMGRHLYVGLSDRTDAAGVAQLGSELRPFGYEVHGVELRGCLHLKSACCCIAPDTILINRSWVDTSKPFPEVPSDRRGGSRARRRECPEHRGHNRHAERLSTDGGNTEPRRFPGRGTRHDGADEGGIRRYLFQPDFSRQ